jgi:hypothetical protein
MWFIWHPIKPGQGDLTSGIRRTWKEDEQWNKIKKMAGKTGKEGMRSELVRCDGNVDLQLAGFCQDIPFFLVRASQSEDSSQA